MVELAVSGCLLNEEMRQDSGDVVPIMTSAPADPVCASVQATTEVTTLVRKLG